MLNVQPVAPSPAALYDKKSQQQPIADQDQEDDHVYLRSTWVFAAFRHPMWRVANCTLRLVVCFLVCVTSPLLTSRQAPAYFPVYSDLVAILFTDVSAPKLLLHSAISMTTIVFVRLVVYRLWFDQRWNWQRQSRHARQTFRRLSRPSSGLMEPHNHNSGSSRSSSETTIALRMDVSSQASEQVTTRVRVHTAPRAQGSWTLVCLLSPFVWFAIMSLLRPIVAGTSYEQLFFGRSETAEQLPQWRLQIIVYNVLMTTNALLWLVTVDETIQDMTSPSAPHHGHPAPSTSATRRTTAVVRLFVCWLFLLAMLVGVGVVSSFPKILLSTLTEWSQHQQTNTNSPTISIFMTLASESWRCHLSSILVILDILWLLQDPQFPGFASRVGSRLYGLPCDFLSLKIPFLSTQNGQKRHKICFTSKWLRGFLVLGVLFPLDICNFIQDFQYNPAKFAQIVDKNSKVLLPAKTPSEVLLSAKTPPYEIQVLMENGSLGTFLNHPFLDRVPAVTWLVMALAWFLWMQDREKWRLCFATATRHATRAMTLEKINSVVPQKTRVALTNQTRLYHLYRIRSQLDLLGASLAGVSVVAVVLQVRSIWQDTTTTTAKSSNIAGITTTTIAAGEPFGVLLVAVSLLMACQLYHQYKIKHEIMQLRQQIPQGPRQVAWWRSSPVALLLLPFVLEILISCVCVPPFVHGNVYFGEKRYFILKQSRFPMICPPQMVLSMENHANDDYKSCELQYKYPVEVLNLVVLARLYWLVRLFRNEIFRRLFANKRSSLLCTSSMSNIGPNTEISSIKWSFRMCLSLFPWRVVGGILVLLVGATASAVSILERPFPSLLDQEAHSLWLTIVTISSVGYGDAYPVTSLGRLAIIVGAVLGGAVVVSLLTSLFLETLKNSKEEHKFVQILEKMAFTKKLHHKSAILIATAWKLSRNKSTQKDDTLLLLRLARKFKKERKCASQKWANSAASGDQQNLRAITQWLNTQLSGWVQETTSQRKELVESLEKSLDDLEHAFLPWL